MKHNLCGLINVFFYINEQKTIQLIYSKHASDRCQYITHEKGTATSQKEKVW